MITPETNQEWVRRTPQHDVDLAANRVIVVTVLSRFVFYSPASNTAQPVRMVSIADFTALYAPSAEAMGKKPADMGALGDITETLKRMDDICARPKCESPRHYNIHDPERGGHEFVERESETPVPRLTRLTIWKPACGLCGLQGGAEPGGIMIPAVMGYGLKIITEVRNRGPVDSRAVTVSVGREPGPKIFEWSHQCPGVTVTPVTDTPIDG